MQRGSKTIYRNTRAYVRRNRAVMHVARDLKGAKARCAHIYTRKWRTELGRESTVYKFPSCSASRANHRGLIAFRSLSLSLLFSALGREREDLFAAASRILVCKHVNASIGVDFFASSILLLRSMTVFEGFNAALQFFKVYVIKQL